ncbi:hypothetical protein Poli38472_000572 [Pythium oligandrum]|uniref:peptidylprolyl isomerase n=1 Tax=Pythium oligandrum TaxID=41045 RepID=A0A8K1CCZ4_PYTOL|nr:hypothetical protein Poli38472_000572 [Pythium oligandrum]|eukprot:TMW60530.1 hypothetical protein Poli38472_000572 [Pythium oligandrum]
MGVEVETIRPGDGKNYPREGDALTMHYTGTLKSDGSKFDSSRDRNEPFQFVIGVGEVIEGWDVGVMKMSLGEKAVLHITHDSAYGDDGIPGAIAPKSDLVFDVELLAIGNKVYTRKLTAEEEQARLDSFMPAHLLPGAAPKKKTVSKSKKGKKKKN